MDTDFYKEKVLEQLDGAEYYKKTHKQPRTRNQKENKEIDKRL